MAESKYRAAVHEMVRQHAYQKKNSLASLKRLLKAVNQLGFTREEIGAELRSLEYIRHDRDRGEYRAWADDWQTAINKSLEKAD